MSEHTVLLFSHKFLLFINNQISTASGTVTVNLPSTVQGTATLQLLVATVGLVNYGAHMEV